MNKLQILQQLVEVATVALEAKKRQIRPLLRRATIRKMNLRQAEVTEKDIERALAPLFEKQIKRIAAGLEGMDEKGTGLEIKSTKPNPTLIQHVFDQKQATAELVDAVMPILAIRMAEAARNQLVSLGVDPRKKSVGLKFNPNHDEQGRFTTGGGAGGMGSGQPTLMHGTSYENALKIIDGGFKPGELHSVFATPNKEIALAYGWGRAVREADRTGVESPDAKFAVVVIKDTAEGFTRDPGMSPSDTWQWSKHGGVPSEDILRVEVYSAWDKNGPPIEVITHKSVSSRIIYVVIPIKVDEEKSFSSTKTTTATEWLMEHPDDVAKLEEMLVDLGLPYQVFTELPPWMKKNIVQRLNESFQQDYWAKISEATAGDAEMWLTKGLQEGWSIRDMAQRMAYSFQEETGKYAMRRAENIARTESGNALNGARKGVMDQLAEDLGDRVPMKAVWMSVLGNTTRDSHAALDGVPADKNGMWYLGGVNVPWPGHYSLPPSERCNCQCSIVTEFGMLDGDAMQLIQEYNDGNRLYEESVGRLTEKFNPYHDEQGRFATGGGAGGMAPDMGGSFGGGSGGTSSSGAERLSGSLAPSLPDAELVERAQLFGLQKTLRVDGSGLVVDLPAGDLIRVAQLEMMGSVPKIQLTEYGFKIPETLAKRAAGDGWSKLDYQTRRQLEADKLKELTSLEPKKCYELLDQEGFIVHKGKGEGESEWASRTEDAITKMTAEQKDQFIDEFPKMVKAFDGKELESFYLDYQRKDFSSDQLRRLSDNFESIAGGAPHKTTFDSDSKKQMVDFYSAVDRHRRNLWEFTSDYESFRTGVAHDWSMMGGGSTQAIIREASMTLPSNAGKTLWGSSGDARLASGYDKARVAENVRKLKVETEQFYKKKFAKKKDPDPDLSKVELTIHRGVAGIKDQTYRPGGAESWTKSEATARKTFFTGGEGGVLSGKTTYNDILFSYESFKGNPGWPADSQLKGKQEFVPLGGGIKDLTFNRVQSKPRRGGYL